MNAQTNQKRMTWVWTVAAVAIVGGVAFWQDQTRARAGQAVQAALTGDPHVGATSVIEAGRYIVKVGGCNDCHTPGFAMKNGDVPESEWLTGSAMGFRGPWGTTYASNLRLFVKDMAENDFVMIVKSRNSRPPMPWPSLHAMSDRDLRAVYGFLKSLPMKGDRTPDYVPPGEEPKTPYQNFEPIFPVAGK